MSEPDLAAAADASYFDWWRVWASSAQGGAFEEDDGLLLAATGAPQEWWNVAAVTRPLADPEAAVRRALDWFSARDQPFIMRIREGVDPASEAAADEAGLPYTDTIPGFSLYPLDAIPEPHPELEIRSISTPVDIETAVAIGIEAFHMEAASVQHLAPARMIANPNWRVFLGSVGGEPAATSAVLITGSVAGIYWVATAERFRRRGFGEAVTWHAVREGAAAGCSVATLQASDMGRPVYERMGFRLVAPYKTFVPRIQPGRGT
jgi:GNAT superfamily N-acetyltransferase